MTTKNTLRCALMGTGLSILMAGSAVAGVGSDMDSVFNSTTVATPTGVYETQAGGALIGGSVAYRPQRAGLQPANISLPRASGGCGGIDAWAGGFSWLSGEQLTQFSRGVIQAAPGILFDLAVSKLSEQLKDTFTKFRDMAQRINEFQMDSCETAQYAIGTIGSKMGMERDTVCKLVGTNTGRWASQLTGRNACTNDTTASAAANDAAGRTDRGPIGAFNVNPVWMELKKLNSSVIDDNQRYFLMAISGTRFQVGPTGASATDPKLINHAPLSLTDAMLGSFMNGGDVTIYRCDETSKCLAPTPGTWTIAADKGFERRVSDLLVGMVNDYDSRIALSVPEIAFIETTRLPVWRIIQICVDTAGAGACRGEVRRFAKPIAAEMTRRFVIEQGEIAYRAAMSSPNITNEDLASLQDNLESTRQVLEQFVTRAEQQTGDMNVVVERWRTAQAELMLGASGRFGMAVRWSRAVN